MKTIKYVSLAFALLSLNVSCNDDFMERQPLDKISDGNYWKTTNDLKLYLNSLYDKNELLAREDGWGSIGPYGWDADNGSDTEVRYTYNTRMNGEKTIADDKDGWGTDDWAPLRSINYFLDHYKTVEEATSFDAVKQYVGEALFFRAGFYFEKLKRYGDLPWAETTVGMDSEVLQAARTPRNQIVENILGDLDKAISYLPGGASGWTGRLTKETAMALQSRIALYEGTWEKYHAADDFRAATNKSQQFLEKAAAVSGQLIALSASTGYPALDNVGVENGYRDLFNQENYSSSKEVLFWRKYEAGAINSIWDRYSSNGAGRGATKNLIDSYLKADGTPVAAGYDDASLLKIVENRDPRLGQTIQINDKKHYRWDKANPIFYFTAPAFDGWDSEESCPTGYQIYKGHNFRYADARAAGQGLQALIYFRYAEVLLNYAEAKAELGTISQDDLDKSINKLRKRVGMPDLTTNVAKDPNFEFSSLKPIIQAVRRERKVELACEGFRVDDIFRWAAAGELIVGKIPVGAKKASWVGFKFSNYLPEATPDLSRQAKFDERVAALETDANGYIKIFKNTLNKGTEGFKFKVNRDYLLPIPTNQVTLNPNLKQNPGW
ncbi:RagB/SusD family nutrient uptake outer membrane protein [Sphingobacterium sp. HMA12]|uniref:RagB/SusD family nutrient uptake outer membrane protein n=1 Tax=Sphingobacterium sp. HMA12 TaxID=2050894 RepID=UPI000CEA6065|nr:RagB/SusD family nutrient uptake outer membrane protein [Sphingobacterium sp. HMA12]